MNKKQEKILKEIRKMEIEIFKDVEKTAEKINKERREKNEKKVFTEYPKEGKTDSFVNDSQIPITMKGHIKNGSKTESA